MCVLATVLGAIDFGFHVIVLSDAVCSCTDETHNAAVNLLGDRFSVQLKLLDTDTFLCSMDSKNNRLAVDVSYPADGSNANAG